MSGDIIYTTDWIPPTQLITMLLSLMLTASGPRAAHQDLVGFNSDTSQSAPKDLTGIKQINPTNAAPQIPR